METGLLHLHNILRWVILVLLIISIYTTYTAQNSNNKKFWLFTLIAAHTTLLIGLYQVFQKWQLFTADGTVGMKDIMKNKGMRFWIIEHPILMILAIILITLAYSNTKKLKYKKAFQLFLVALVVILAAVPWPFRDELIRRPWFPGM
jgi:ABC-type iron transport system FetAB permease component